MGVVVECKPGQTDSWLAAVEVVGDCKSGLAVVGVVVVVVVLPELRYGPMHL